MKKMLRISEDVYKYLKANTNLELYAYLGNRRWWSFFTTWNHFLVIDLKESVSQ